MNRLDQQRLINLRLSRGLAVRQLARDCGIEIAVLNRLETTDDPRLSNLSVAALIRVADHLGVPAADLFTTDNHDRDSNQPSSQTPTGDIRMLGALLTALDTDTPITAIADGLEWDVPRVHAAARTLDRHLRPLGTTVYRNSGLIGLRPVDETHSDAEVRVRRNPRTKLSQRLVTPARARLLYRAMHTPISPHSLSTAARINIAVLLKAGALVEDKNRCYVPSPDVRDSLGPAARS